MLNNSLKSAINSSKSAIKRLEREASDLRKRIFHLRIVHLDDDKEEIIKELSAVLALKNKTLLLIRFGNTL